MDQQSAKYTKQSQMGSRYLLSTDSKARLPVSKKQPKE